MRNSTRTLPLIAVLLVTPTRAHAQQAAADALFDSARAAMAKGAFAEACEQFRASDQLDPAVGTELNLADCEEKRGHLASAWELFRTVEEKLPENDERVPVAHARAQALQARVPKLTLQLAPGAPKDSTVRDGKVALGSAAFGVALPLEPGPHELQVSAPGFESRTFQLSLAEGEARSLTVGPGDPVPAAATSSLAVVAGPTSKEASARDGSSSRALGFTLAGVGVTGIGVGAVAGLMMLSKKHTVAADCRPDKSCTSTGLDAAHSAHSLQTVSNIGWLVGAAALGASAYFLLSGGPSATPSTALAVSTSPSGGALSLARTW